MAAWGADAQYTRLVEQHAPTLLRLALLMTANVHDAEDAVQDALVSVAASWQRTRPTKALAYLKRAVANECIDLIHRRRAIPVGEVPDTGYDDLGFLRLEEDQRFFALVGTLPERQRLTLVLRYFADLDDRAIAAALDCSPETVRSQAHRGLEKLRSAESALTERG